jgi:hypothetical protein
MVSGQSAELEGTPDNRADRVFGDDAKKEPPVNGGFKS